MFYSLRTRIGTLYILLILALMAGLGLYLSGFIERTVLTDLEDRLESEARLTGRTILPMLADNTDPEQIDKLAKTISADIGARVTILDENGVVMGESAGDWRGMENHADRPEIIEARLTGSGSAQRYSETLGYDMIYVAFEVEAGNETLGFARVGLSLSDLQQRIGQMRRTLLLATLLAAILAGLLAAWISSRTTRPLRELTLAANQIAEGNLSTRLLPSSQDEIGRLTETFNTMAVQLEERVQDVETERSRIAAVLSVMSDGVIIIDRENRIQLSNPSARAMFQIGIDEARGHSVFEYVRHQRMEAALAECRSRGEPVTVQLDFPAHQLTLQATAASLGLTQPGNMLLLFQDLTRLRRLETVRQDFISNISHELRTPLASLKALTETLNGSALEDPPAARRFLNRMDVELDALSQMVGELLELSRIESARVPLQFAPTSACQLLEQAAERLSTQAERAGLQVEIDCSEDLPPVLADPERLVQVLVNLLHNAIKFTPTGGSIQLSAQKQEEVVRFSVADTGSGIPASEITRIFERFYKTDRARSGGGTGLGLAIARHLVEAHGGRIWAESIEGRGSTFHFTIPAAGQINPSSPVS
jgi:two-component system phosphate regulon sensor histidine kinase PhoR